MKNFIRHNIQNVKGTKRAGSIERESPKHSPIKHYSNIKNTSIQQRVS